jgi:hypothetical protein
MSQLLNIDVLAINGSFTGFVKCEPQIVAIDWKIGFAVGDPRREWQLRHGSRSQNPTHGAPPALADEVRQKRSHAGSPQGKVQIIDRDGRLDPPKVMSHDRCDLNGGISRVRSLECCVYRRGKIGSEYAQCPREAAYERRN